MFKRILVVFLFSIVFSGVANASEWIVERATKDVSVSANGASWRTVKTGEAVPNAHWIRTGPRARVILAKGGERIMYHGNTLAAISVSQPSGQKTKVTQRRGSVLLSVEKRRRQHTSVVTPHLAAVVKGTVFEVTVRSTGSDARVDRGRVEVSDGDRSVSVRAGQVAAVKRSSTGIEVARATETSLAARGKAGLELAEVKSNDNAGGNGNGNAGGQDYDDD